MTWPSVFFFFFTTNSYNGEKEGKTNPQETRGQRRPTQAKGYGTPQAKQKCIAPTAFNSQSEAFQPRVVPT